MSSNQHPDLWSLYRMMLRSRSFESVVSELWQAGSISGEMHLAVGEEGICAGVVDHLKDGDALALDHRGTPPLLMRGVDPTALLNEMLGRSDGLCGGMGGHMHLFSREHLAATSGIVGASGPGAVGFALAGHLLRPGSISVAFFGEGAVNQGMLMESLNLASVWKLPVLFVCKDNRWAITTRSDEMTAGGIKKRLAAFGIPLAHANGADVEAVWRAAAPLVRSARRGRGPGILLADCVRPEGHFLGDALLRLVRNPVHQARLMTGPLVRSVTRVSGAGPIQRISSLTAIAGLIKTSALHVRFSRRDPLERLRKKLHISLETFENDFQTLCRQYRPKGFDPHPAPVADS